MKKPIFVAMLMLPFLGGCLSVDTPPPTPTPIVSLLPTDVQGYILKGCGIAISTQTAQVLISTFIPGVDKIGDFIRSICKYLVKSEATRGRASGDISTVFRGKVITGRRVAYGH